MKRIRITEPDIVVCAMLCDPEYRAVLCSMTPKALVQSLVKVKSSNIWAMTIDIDSADDDTGDMYIQFKGRNGGPDDIYMYFDVPVLVYRKMITAPSKGHYFWQHIRGRYPFRKLTGNKRTVQPGGIN